YFPESLVRQSNNVLSKKVLFGTDFPLITPEKWLAAFANLPLKDEVRPGILKDNAVKVLGLAASTERGSQAEKAVQHA
ncbi:MAG TPA: amidohydrolase family protein, partial [Corynebacterium glutamicum]|nr:amidohydrolase family protein [Corynebacterium glutamicum]